MANKFAIVTGASSGIGLELARLAARDGYDLLVVADTPLVDAAAALKDEGVDVQSVETDLSTIEGVDRLLAAAGGRRVDLLCANAGHGLGGGFLDQDVSEWRHVIDTNITGTVYLLQKVLRQMRDAGEGKVLITGSIAGWIPGSFQAVYNGSKAFVDNFAAAIRNELKEVKGITITTLLPGPVETEFFERAGMMDTKVGQSESKSDPADVAKDGWTALMKGTDNIVSGLSNKLQVAGAGVLPQSVTAEQHRKIAEPGSGE
ncbi:SDR family NAD(P)-dependent oxidoreductase [Sphingomonas sp. ABOLD]|uniref:Short-subunit dehydrogenase n=1 Tax=Sphingomonas trueperi TaxID=53317 RepID=A0A7X5Y1J1_9SPHN|nr:MULTISPECIES: SDR family NAD(P)-dependent oxidoreductase [Sphingomonas]NJB99368.1 short-subunit dehydrogenase [Sphingomonas trueperi]RSV48517.1 SDR family NAD(P)-dependent oxidoreductase [Sphingomonas sp. ABOLD]